MAINLPGSLIDTAWLVRALTEDHDDLVVADVRWYPNRPAREGFESGHVPGAVFVDVDGDLAAPVRPDRRGGRHRLPAPDVFADTMARLGVGDDGAVVTYDDVGGAYATRLWWMLKVTGHRAALLDGGLRGWDGELETGPGRDPPRATFTARPWPEDVMVSADQVEALRSDAGAVLLDARAPERYRGDVEPIDRAPGHIPGARNAPFADNLDPATGRFLPAAELRERYAGKGVDGSKRVVAYCGSGVTACLDLFALELAGLRGDLYVGSWSDWISDPTRPMATGPEPEQP